ncbi:unnamed protein product [Anisakis simplex]|uniref:Secreted protein n=1 Tax=Anisakis simplex TaxID=6269 RepID=A0A0M3JXY1_ANISI|nr:unnamed protein product [Anisakis simplex]
MVKVKFYLLVPVLLTLCWTEKFAQSSSELSTRLQKRFHSLAHLRNGRLYLANENTKTRGIKRYTDDVVTALQPDDDDGLMYTENDASELGRYYLPWWTY